MLKEAFIAIFVGILIGGVVTYGIYTANQAIKHQTSGLTPQTTTIPTPKPTPKPALQLSITQPNDGSLLTDPQITILGLTRPNAVVALTSENKDMFIKADAEGNFSQDLKLNSGSNLIKIAATDGEQISTIKNLHLVYEKNSKKQ